MATRLQDAQVAVVGLGLMGGSLAGALRGSCRSVVGVSRREETIAAARVLDLVDWGTTDLRTGIDQADVVVLATPVRVILQQLAELGSMVREDCLVLDLGSTKSEIVAAMAELPPHVQPLGGHPMCGKELSGIEAADRTLYRGRTFILTPLERTAPWALQLGSELAEAAGCHTLILDAERQDSLVASLSHLPYMLACALVATVDATTSTDPAAWEIVAGGYRDTSRVAGSDVTMMLDILVTNRAQVLQAVEVCQNKLADLAALLSNGQEKDLAQALHAIRDRRREMYL